MSLRLLLLLVAEIQLTVVVLFVMPRLPTGRRREGAAWLAIAAALVLAAVALAGG